MSPGKAGVPLSGQRRKRPWPETELAIDRSLPRKHTSTTQPSCPAQAHVRRVAAPSSVGSCRPRDFPARRSRPALCARPPRPAQACSNTREPRVEKSNGMTPVASEKRCISQPVARRPGPDGPPWQQEPPQLTNCLRNKRPDARMGHRTAPAHAKTCVLSSRTERLGVVPKIRTTPSGPLPSEHQRRDRVVPAAARTGPRRASHRWRRPTPRAPSRTRSSPATPQWWNVARPTRSSFFKLSVVVRRISSSPESLSWPPSPGGSFCVSGKIGQKLSVLASNFNEIFLC